MGEPIGVGIIGLGAISAQYLQTLAGLQHPSSRCRRRPECPPSPRGRRRPGRRAGAVGRSAARGPRRQGRREPHPACWARADRVGRDRSRKVGLQRETARDDGGGGREIVHEPTRAGVRVGRRPTPCWAPASRPHVTRSTPALIGTPTAAIATFLCRGPRELAPEPRLLLRRRWWSAAGHGPVLRHGAGDTARTGRFGDRCQQRFSQRPGRSGVVRGPGRRSPFMCRRMSAGCSPTRRERCRRSR